MARYRTDEEKAILLAYAHRRWNTRANLPGTFQSILFSVVWSLTTVAPEWAVPEHD